MPPLVGHREKYCLLASTWIPFGVLKTGGKNWVYSPQILIICSRLLNPSVFLWSISMLKIRNLVSTFFTSRSYDSHIWIRSNFKSKQTWQLLHDGRLGFACPHDLWFLGFHVAELLSSCEWWSMINYNYMQSIGWRFSFHRFLTSDNSPKPSENVRRIPHRLAAVTSMVWLNSPCFPSTKIKRRDPIR